VENAVDRVYRRELPEQFPGLEPCHLSSGQQQSVLSEASHDLLGGPQLLEALEDKLDGAPDVDVGIFDHPPVLEADETCGQGLAVGTLLDTPQPAGFEPEFEEVYLRLAHHPSESQE